MQQRLQKRFDAQEAVRKARTLPGGVPDPKLCLTGTALTARVTLAEAMERLAKTPERTCVCDELHSTDALPKGFRHKIPTKKKGVYAVGFSRSIEDGLQDDIIYNVLVWGIDKTVKRCRHSGDLVECNAFHSRTGLSGQHQRRHYFWITDAP